MNGSNQNVIVICCFFSLGPISGMGKCSPFWAGHGSSGYVFRASFARLSQTFRSKSLKKMSRYYLLSGVSRIFRKSFANVYISRKVPFAQTFQIYACGPRLYKTFHGFLHDSHISIYTYNHGISFHGILSQRFRKKNASNTPHLEDHPS